MFKKLIGLLVAVVLVATNAHATPWGLVGNWNFNDGTANDSSISSANGTLDGGASIVTDPSGNSTRGKVLDARDYIGSATNARVIAAPSSNWAFSDYYTVNAWLMIPTVADGQKSPWNVSVAVSATEAYSSPRIVWDYYSGDGNIYTTGYNTYINASTGSPYVLSSIAWGGAKPVGPTWHMLTVTLEAGINPGTGQMAKIQKQYVDGVLGTTDYLQTANDGRDPIAIGAMPFTMGGENGSSSWSGYVDDVGYWHGWLDQTAITGLYNGAYTTATAPVNVPEPATMVLLGLGGLLLRRKN